MGTYLSTPVTDKSEESGECLSCPLVPVAWGVVDMQGWRKSMEDAHVAQTDVDVPKHHYPDEKLADAKVFGVFDGHGGPEVANFCQLYLVSVLTQQETWKKQVNGNGPVKVNDPAQRLMPKETDIGQALVTSFHALDRMIDDPSRREELIRLRATKPSPGERRDADNIPLVKDFLRTSLDPTPSAAPPNGDMVALADLPEDAPKATAEVVVEKLSSKSENTGAEKNGDHCTPTSKSDSDDKDPAPATNSDDAVEAGDDDDDSNEAVGKEEAALNDQDMMDDDSDLDDSQDSPTAAGKVSVIFQKLLNMSAAPAGQLVVQLTNPASGSGSDESATSSTSSSSEQGTSGSVEATPSGPSASLPTMVRNGRLICNLPDHPIHAGATAVVVVMVGRTITVANAGDSRAVLCRNGTAYPLSFDHKPLQERELNRIRNAGGFVNHFGRVNGNLNLSRSIGDMKYKQVPNIPPSEQMITAEPDIVQVEIGDEDEFIVMGCDGIWDCLTNEKAVEYVRDRIDSKTPTEIGVEMLNDIISEDPRATQGIGGDNMTVMIVDLQPLSRSHRTNPEPSSPV